MTDSELRALAETCLDGSRTGMPMMSDLAEFHRAATPDVVLSLLDRLAAAEKVVEAAREYKQACWLWDHWRIDGPSPDDALAALYAALAALDGGARR